MESLEQRVYEIEERNKTVELDKAWETSIARRALIIALTYAVVGIFLQTIRIERPWTTAIAPAIAFVLSTLTIPLFKKVWIKRQSPKQK